MVIFQTLIRRQDRVVLLAVAATHAGANHAHAQEAEQQNQRKRANHSDAARHQALAKVWQLVAKHIDADRLVAIPHVLQPRFEIDKVAAATPVLRIARRRRAVNQNLHQHIRAESATCNNNSAEQRRRSLKTTISLFFVVCQRFVACLLMCFSVLACLSLYEYQGAIAYLNS